MIHYSISLIEILTLGWALGLLYFGGLWLTLQRFPKARRPMILMVWSYVIRLGAVLGVFHLILQVASQDQILMLLGFSFLGFILSRNFLINRIRPRDG